MAADHISRTFGSVLVAMVTPFTDQGELDLPSAQRLATLLVDSGCDGLVVSGTTGESPTTSPAEQEALLRAVVEAVGDRATIVAGAGTNDTAHSVELAVAAAKAGAAGTLVVAPYYSKTSQAGIVAHCTTIADATDLPMMLYDIPGRSVIAMEPETLVQLAEHPRIKAVKDAKGDFYSAAWVMQRTDLEFYSGDDDLNLQWLASGGSGMVSVVGHVAAGHYRRMVEAVAAGDLATARAINAGLLPAIRGIMKRAQGAVMAKAALQLQGALPGRHLRLPLLPATDQEVALLRADLEEAKLL